MRPVLVSTFVAVFLSSLALAQPAPRVSSDFEILTLEKQLSTTRDPMLLVAAYLNLGDVRTSRSELRAAQVAYRKALELSETERVSARSSSNLTAYAFATAYAGLIHAKLANRAESFEMLEESLRYSGGSAKNWNLYSSAMLVAGLPAKAAGASRRAITMATTRAKESGSLNDALDVHIYEYALASALIAMQERSEAERLLRSVTKSLESSRFQRLRRQVERAEMFEIYSSSSSEATAYLSLLNRTYLRLGRIYEDRHSTGQAREQYRKILRLRTDDAQALAALVRLTPDPAERGRLLTEAFDANPFSMSLISEYERLPSTLSNEDSPGAGAGQTVRRALLERANGLVRRSSETLQTLLPRFPSNDTLLYLLARNDVQLGLMSSARDRVGSIQSQELRNEILSQIARSQQDDGEWILRASASTGVTALGHVELKTLVARLRRDDLLAVEKSTLDRQTFVSEAYFDPPLASDQATVTLQGGRFQQIRFRFPSAARFQITHKLDRAVRLEYRILGLSEESGMEVLLVEPVRITP